jgi:uncharacterized protein (TIGR03089 family)
MSTPESLFSARLTSDPSRPLITFYDDATGERAELSAKSLGNWVAKTHFLLLDELGLSVGARAFVRLPVHWLAAPVLLGCWFAGLEVVSSPEGADVAFGDAESLLALNASPDAGALGLIPDVYAVSLLSMARSAEPPTGMADYAASVRPQPDAWGSVRAQAGPAEVGLDGQRRDEVGAQAAEVAETLGLAEGGRLLWTEPDFGPQAWVLALLAPLAVRGSTVLVRNADRALTERRAAAEQVTVVR